MRVAFFQLNFTENAKFNTVYMATGKLLQVESVAE